MTSQTIPVSRVKSKMLHSLYVRGRHNMISTITATQQSPAIHPIIRVNATELYVYRSRNSKDLESFIDEVSAVADKKTFFYNYIISQHLNHILCYMLN